MTVDDWLGFLKRTRAYHFNIIGLLSEGLMVTAEVRGGGLTNTSSESLVHHRRSLSEVENMLVELAASGAA